MSRGTDDLPCAEYPGDARLTAEGWVRRFVADRARAQEAIELYARMGYETRAEPVMTNEIPQACAGCAVAACRDYVVVYTRRKT